MKLFRLAFLLVFLAGSTAAQAAFVFNTGVNNSGTVLSDGTSDSHYTVTYTGVGSISSNITTARTSAGGFPIPPWLPDNTTSAWISPRGDRTFDPNPGFYTYKTTFNVSAAQFVLNSGTFAGRWAVDNRGADILVNGRSLNLQTITNAQGNSFQGWTNFAFNAGSAGGNLFVNGLNTIEFKTFNSPQNFKNPSGLRVEWTTQTFNQGAPVVPLPPALALMACGLPLVGFVRRRLSK